MDRPAVRIAAVAEKLSGFAEIARVPRILAENMLVVTRTGPDVAGHECLAERSVREAEE